MKKLLLIFLVVINFFACTNKKVVEYTDEKVISAVVMDNSYILSSAIENGFDINKRFRNGENLLTIALKENSLKSLSILLNNGVNLVENVSPNKIAGNEIKYPQRTAIFYANSIEALKLLITYGANINEVDSEGELLLNYFIKNKPEEFAIELIESGANLDIVDNSKWAPIFWAVNIENEAILKAILEKDSRFVYQKDFKKNIPIYYSNSEEILDILLNYDYDLKEKNIYGENILGEVYLKAKQLDYKEIIKKLLDKGVNKNYTSYSK